MSANAIDLSSEVECAAGGDHDAFGRLVAAHQSMVCSVAYAITGDFALSEEIAQEVFLIAWQRLPQLREPSRLASWLAAIARNEAKDAVQRSNREVLGHADGLRSADGRTEGRADEAAIRAEREQITWDTVSRLPDVYRAALILYYREGHSVREVARLLEITEDCAKQRLSRGRRILRDHIAAVVEETLLETRPNNTFTLAVVAALPALAAPATAGKTLAAGAAAAKAGSLAAKPVTTVLGTGMLGGLTGAVMGMTGGFFGMWMGIKNAQTLFLRRYMLKMCAVMYGFVWLFLGYEAACGTLLWRRPLAMGWACGAGWALYLPLLFLLITWSNKRGRRIMVAEEQGEEVPAGCSLASVWRTLLWAFPAAAIGSASIVLWLHLLPGVSGWWGAGVAVFSHCVFLRVFLRGTVIARDEVIFAETAPRLRTSERGTVEATLPPAQAKPAWLNDCLALCGGILGGSLALIVPLAEQGMLAWSMTLACAQAAVATTAMIAVKTAPRWRRWILFFALLTAGEINAVVTFLNPMPWFEAFDVQASGDAISMTWRILTAAVCFGIYFVIGLAMLVIGKREEDRGTTVLPLT